MPEDLAELSPEEQQRSIKRRAALMMGFATLVIILFSDPMVDVMTNLGRRVNIPPFYIAFARERGGAQTLDSRSALVCARLTVECDVHPARWPVAPLASNLSELIASYQYAGRKTKKTITVALASLEGAAIMNNTFCLAIMCALVYFKQLAWQYCAETLSILVVELAVFFIAIMPLMRLWHALVLLAIFPLSIVFVAVLEALGYD